MFLIITYLSGICKALVIEILVSSTSAGVSFMPQASNKS
jgi:hypothetical protein